MQDIELRVHPSQFKIEDDELLLVEGLVNKTEEWSHMLGTKQRFREKIKAGVFTRALDRAKSVDFLAEHNANYLLSSTANNSLELWEDEEGLKMRAQICPTSYGKDFYALMKSGLLAHMSFGFKIRSQNWKKMIDGTFERIINDLDLLEVSAVRNPAYPQSAISARGFTIIDDVEINETELIELEERAEEVEHKDNSETVLTQVLSQLNTLHSEVSSLKSLFPQKEEQKQEINEEEVKVEEVIQDTNKVENTECQKTQQEEIVQEVAKTETKQEQIIEESPKSPDLSSYYKDLLEIYQKESKK